MFSVPRAYDPPGAPAGAQWTFQIAVKTFEANTLALLEAAMNVWLVTTNASTLDVAILSVNYQSGAKERVVVTYGFFVNITP